MTDQTNEQIAESIRDDYARQQDRGEYPTPYGEAVADFDAWLKSVKAGAWNEGAAAGGINEYVSGPDQEIVNPYIGAEMVKLGYEGLRAERDGYAAVIAAIGHVICTDTSAANRSQFSQSIQDLVNSVDKAAVVQAIRDKAFEEAAGIAESMRLNSESSLAFWREVAAAIRSQQGGKDRSPGWQARAAIRSHQTDTPKEPDRG